MAGGVCHPIVLRPVHLERGFSGVFGAVTSRHLTGHVGLETFPPESKEMHHPGANNNQLMDIFSLRPDDFFFHHLGCQEMENLGLG